MSDTILTVFTSNPASSMQITDLLYLGRYPYDSTDDFAITWQNMMASITELGTISAGIWNGDFILPEFGGTGVDNGSNTLTLAGNLTTSGGFASTFTMTGATNVTFPTSGTLSTTEGTVTSVSGTSGFITSTGGNTPVIDIDATYVGQTSLTTLGTISTGLWQGTLIGSTYGGTGVDNGSNTLTLAGNLSTSGAFASTFTMTAATSVTFPTSGTLATVAGTVSSITGTSNEITASASTGAVTLSIPNNPVLPGTGGVQVPSGTTAQRAGSAGTIRLNTQTSLFESTVDGSTWATIETSAVGVTSVAGTANEILVNGTTGSGQTGALTLTLPQAIGTSNTPIFAGLNDTNNLPILSFTTAASATDYFNIVNGIANKSSISVVSSNTNASFSLIAKGTGGVVIGSLGATTTPLALQVGSNDIGFSVPTLTTNRVYTFPDISGTIVLNSTGIKAPTIQKFTSGSGTYTTPAGVLYINTKMVGAGGGGSGGGTSGQGTGGTGGNTTFGTSLLVANGASGGVGGGAGGVGGTASLGSGPIGTAIQGATGQGAGVQGVVSTYEGAGAAGASSPFGGAGSGTNQGGSGNAGGAAIANSGSGGGGSSVTNSANNASGAGGGAGGYIDALISSPLSTYSYAVGAGGTAGTAGASGSAGGAGGSGYIIITEYYQ
jgi:hypothetical protein